MHYCKFVAQDVVTAEGEGCEGSGSGCAGSGPSEDEEECVSSPAGSHYDDGGDMKNAMSDEVTKQLAAAGEHETKQFTHRG